MPTRVGYYEVTSAPNWGSNGSTKNTDSFQTFEGDLIVVKAAAEQAGTDSNVEPFTQGFDDPLITWTRHANVGDGANASGVWIWTGEVLSDAFFAVGLNHPLTDHTQEWGFSVSVWSGHGGVGAVFAGSFAGNSAPSVTMTCAANSGIEMINDDWFVDTNGTGRTYRTINGTAMTEAAFYYGQFSHNVYDAYHPNTGVGGPVTVGMTAPSSQRWSLAAVEILAPVVPPLWEEKFEGQPDGTQILASNTAFSNGVVTGTDAYNTFSTLQAVEGTRSGRVLHTATAGPTSAWHKDYTVRSVIHRRAYIYVATTSSAPQGTLLMVRSGNTDMAQVQRANTSGVVRMRDSQTGGSVVAATSTVPIPVGQWARLEWKVDNVAQTQTLRIFVGANVHGTVPDEEISGIYTMGTFNRSTTGLIASNTGEIFYDGLEDRSEAWPGPIISAPTEPTLTILTEAGLSLLTETGSPLLL